MKFAVLFILTLLLCDKVIGQKYSQALIDSFCNVTIEYYYSDFAKPHDSVEALNHKLREQYILKSEATDNLKTKFNDFSVRYLTKEQVTDEIAKTKDRTGSLESIFVTQLQDTIDIDIYNCEIHVTEVEYVNEKVIPIHSTFGVSCGGTLGYIPTCRFVFNKNTNSWTKYNWRQIAKTKMNPRKKNDDK